LIELCVNFSIPDGFAEIFTVWAAAAARAVDALAWLLQTATDRQAAASIPAPANLRIFKVFISPPLMVTTPEVAAVPSQRHEADSGAHAELSGRPNCALGALFCRLSMPLSTSYAPT
jgi:hypothetical protein